MKKYILRIEEEPCDYEDGMKYYTCIDVPYWQISERTLGKIPELEKGLQAEYQRGLNEAWEMAKEISLLSPEEVEEIFPGAEKYNRYNLGYNGTEAIKTYQTYKKQKEEIKVGDEIIFSDGTTGYVIMPDYNEKDMLVSTSDCACLQLIRKSNKNPFFKWEKTGMRNGEIVKMVKAIKAESL